jgi:hypothetical protein
VPELKNESHRVSETRQVSLLVSWEPPVMV